MNVIERINDLRNSKGWSIYTLALESGITQSTLSSMLLRNTAPKIETLECICDAFGITLAQFFLTEEHTEYLSEQELELIKNFRKLPNDKKQILIEFLK